MKNKKKYLYLLIILVPLVVLFVNFKYATEVRVATPKVPQTTDLMTLSDAKTFQFSLDSLTSPSEIEYFEYFKDKSGNKFLTFLNANALSVYFYNMLSGKLEKQISLENFGYTLSDRIQGYHILNKDSLFVYGYRNFNFKLISLDSGVLLSKGINQEVNSTGYRVFPYVSTGTPILFNAKRNEVYLTGVSADEGGTYSSDKSRTVLATLNFNDGVVSYGIHYPDFYWGKNWGGAGGFRQSYFEQNEKSQLLISFMADHNLIVYDENTKKETKYYAGSRYFKSDIKSLPYGMNYFDFLDSYDIYRYYLGTPSYSMIKYDKFRDVYYRIAEWPIDHPDINSEKGTYKKKSVIILDASFNKIAEVVLPPYTLDLRNFFVTEEGILIKEIDNDKDDLLKFHLFKPVSLKPKT